MNGRYDPFGNVLTTNGSATSVYGFTGEQTDATGLVYLRARYYAPGQGRFTTRDTWGGDDQRPLSLNRWNYTNANPINYTDPSGYWRWRRRSSPRERDIEDYYMGAELEDKQLEYPLAMDPRDARRNKLIDMFNSKLGNVYEVEPIDDRNGNGHGVGQAQRYVNLLNEGARMDWLYGFAPGGAIYDWTDTQFQLGNGTDWRGRYRAPDPLQPDQYNLIADYWVPGLVVWWLEKRDSTESVPVPFPRNVREKDWSKAKEEEYERNGRQWSPSPAPLPLPQAPNITLPHIGPIPVPLIPALRIPGGLIAGGCPAKVH